MLPRTRPPHARLDFRANALKYRDLQKLKHALSSTLAFCRILNLELVSMSTLGKTVTHWNSTYLSFLL